jgi:hypothetical protein
MLAGISSLVVRFSPLQPGAKAAREFVARITAAKIRATNPQCEIVTKLRVAATAPSVIVTHAASKQTETIDISGLSADRIFERLRSLSDNGATSEIMKNFGGTGSTLSSDWDAGRNNAGTSTRQMIVPG